MDQFRLLTCATAAFVFAATLHIDGLHAAKAQTRKPAASPVAPISFINDVAPILKENCFACHDAKKRKGKLDMTTYEGLRKGGTKDDPIVPGKPEESLICDLVTATDKSRMPPREAGDALPKQKIELIARWIKEGAKLDAGLAVKADLLREMRVRWKPPSPPAVYAYPAAVTALAFSPDDQSLVVGGHHELMIWDIAKGALVERVYTRAERTYGLSFLPDGKLAVAGGRPGQQGDVRIYDLHGGTSQKQNGIAIFDGVADKKVMIAELAETDDAVLCLSNSPDGKRLAAGGCDRLVRVWDVSAGYSQARLEQTIENHADWVFGVAFSADGKRLFTASRDKTAKVWDLAAKESVQTFPDHQNCVYGVAVKPDGKIAVSGGEDNQVRFWNATGEGKQVRALGGHSRAVHKVVYHPKQPIVISCSADNTVRIWNADSGAAVRTLKGHSDWIYALALSNDGCLIASGSYNGEVRIWKLADGALVKSFIAAPGSSERSAKQLDEAQRRAVKN
jgi:sugar lactone lactonase YvrE